MKQQQAIQYLAFDVHQATIVANCRDEDGKVVMRATVATEAKAPCWPRRAGNRAGRCCDRSPISAPCAWPRSWSFTSVNELKQTRSSTKSVVPATHSIK